MKKLFILFTVLNSTIAVLGQRSFEPKWIGDETQQYDNPRTISDTLRPWNNATVQPNLFVSQNGGFLVGVNGFGDKQAGQIFIPQYAVTVKGAAFWFGAKRLHSGNPASVVTFKLYALDANNLSNVGSSTAKGPGTILSQTTTAVSSLNADTSFANGINYLNFPNQVNIDSAAGFVLVFDVTTLKAGDTVGLITTADGDGGNKDFSIQQWSNGSWNSFLDPNNWEADLDLYILAIIDHDDPTNLQPQIAEETNFILQPNPAKNICFLQSRESSGTIKIADLEGREMFTHTISDNRLTINTSLWNRGMYVVQMTNPQGKTSFKKLLIEE